MAPFLAALLVASAARAGGPTLDVDGSCPGPMELSASGLTPGGRLVVLIGAAGFGADHIPVGPCSDVFIR